MPTVTLSSVGTSAALSLDYIGAKTTTLGVSLTATTTGAAAFLVEATLDDPMRVTSPTWFLASTTTFSLSSGVSFTALSILTPVAGVRLNSTALSSGSLVLAALQNAGG